MKVKTDLLLFTSFTFKEELLGFKNQLQLHSIGKKSQTWVTLRTIPTWRKETDRIDRREVWACDYPTYSLWDQSLHGGRAVWASWTGMV